MARNRFAAFEPYLLSTLRIIAGFLFIAHGVQKLFGWLGGQRVDLASQAGVAGVLETFGGALLLLGLFTRPVAFVLSGQMAFAYFIVHARQGFWPILNRGELAVIYCFVFLYLAAAGPGPISLDRALRRVR
ncbi:MAG TPA: DoxX family protein [Bryobacteraceae bacterium]|nr:DoxX family protein [Bryobacteraceae bacterium]